MTKSIIAEKNLIMVKKKYQEQQKPSFQLKQQKQNGQNFKAQTNQTIRPSCPVLFLEA